MRCRGRAARVLTFAALIVASSSALTDAHAAAESPPLDPILRAFGVDLEDSPYLNGEQRKTARAAGHRMVSLCPNCRLGTIEEDGPCGWARMNRLIILAAAAKGLTEDAIVQTYVQTYGDRILAQSKQRGFAAASWAVPIVVAILGLILMFVVGQRMRHREEPVHVREDALPERHRLEQELARLDD